MEKLTTKMGLSTLPKRLTREQAYRYGSKQMPKDLRRAGFKVVIFKSDAEIHGGVWYRINYGK